MAARGSRLVGVGVSGPPCGVHTTSQPFGPGDPILTPARLPATLRPFSPANQTTRHTRSRDTSHHEENSSIFLPQRLKIWTYVLGGERTGGRGGHRRRVGNARRVTQGDRGRDSGPGRCAQQGAGSELPAPSTGRPRQRQLRKVTRAGRLAATPPPGTARPGPPGHPRPAICEQGHCPAGRGHPVPPQGVGTSRQTARGRRPLRRPFRHEESPKDSLGVTRGCRAKQRNRGSQRRLTLRGTRTKDVTAGCRREQ